MSDETKTVRCFMDGIDWREHLEYDAMGHAAFSEREKPEERHVTTMPPPGSAEAVKAGCKCPVVDNHHGKGSANQGRSRVLDI